MTSSSSTAPHPQRPPTLTRSITPSQIQTTPTPSSRLRNFPLPNRLVKSQSSSQIKDKAREQSLQQRMREDGVMDTRTPSPSNSSADGVEAYKPDLSKEVAMLSTKLINAINYQTNLDDSLQATRHELEQAQIELKRVQAEKQDLDDAIARGVWVKKSEMDEMIKEIRAELAHEREKREVAEKVKRQTDGELENLTSSLFEEANKMVAEARRDAEAVERRNSQLRGRLSDTETLLASQQEQLQDLKQTMEALERTSTTNAREASVPSTPVNLNSGEFEAFQMSPGAATDAADVSPNHPLHFSQLLHPVLRQDVAAYTEFAELLASARKGAPHSRNASGNMPPSSSTQQQQSSSTQESISTSDASTARNSSPSLPGAFSFTTSHSPSSSTSLAPALKDSKFYKRILTEDLDPTLRLDLAPGLSFLSRRSVQSSLLNGTLIVEPFAPGQQNWKLYAPVFPCALCGESRKGEPYLRKHRFRTSESEEAQRYPLCEFCVGRVRACGDFVGFLRMVREGFWRLGDEGDGGEGERVAWEEAVRLRERMFWARVGGGVVPTGNLSGVQKAVATGGVSASPAKTSGKEGERESLESIPEKEKVSEGEKRELEDDDREEEKSGAKSNMVDGNEVMEAQAKELKRRTMLHLAEVPAAIPVSNDEPSPSQQEHKIDASAQLQQEAAHHQNASSALPSSASASVYTDDNDEDLDRMVSAEEGEPPDVNADHNNDDEDDDDDSAFPPPPVPPHRDGVTMSPRPATASEDRPALLRRESGLSTASSQGSLHPTTAAAAPPEAAAGRRPSSASSVLARVRAMEAKAGGGS